MLALNGGIQFRRFELAAVLSGVDGSYSGNSIRYLDLDAFGRVGVFRPDARGRISLLLGYRRIETKLEYEDEGDNVVFDMDFDGPYAGIEVSF